MQLINGYVETDDDNGDEIDRNQSSVSRTMVLFASHAIHTGDEMDTLLISQYMCSSVRKEFAPYCYTELAQSTRATKAGMGNLHMLSGSVLLIPSACIVQIDVKSIRTLCPDLCREILLHALSGFMSQNPTARFVPPKLFWRLTGMSLYRKSDMLVCNKKQ